MRPTESRKELHLINKLRISVRKDLKNLLQLRGLNSDDANHAVRTFPLVFSNAFFRHDIPHWCFTLDEKMRNFDFVIAVGVSFSGSQQSHEIFSIPTDKFTRGNFFIFSKHEQTYSDLFIEGNQVEEKIHVITDRLSKMLHIQKVSQLTSVVGAGV
jgi:hypothetical protein